MTEASFRKIALGMEGAVEGAHMGHPDFRAGGRIFATLHGNGRTGMVILTPEQQQEFVAAYPRMFEPEAGAWGRQGCTRVHLGAADPEVVGEAMTLAWQRVMSKAKRAPARTASRASKAKGAPARKAPRASKSPRARRRSR